MRIQAAETGDRTRVVLLLVAPDRPGSVNFAALKCYIWNCVSQRLAGPYRWGLGHTWQASGRNSVIYIQFVCETTGTTFKPIETSY